jgi:hypothetical protein
MFYTFCRNDHVVMKTVKNSILMTSYDMTAVTHSFVENRLTSLFNLTLFHCLRHFTSNGLLRSHWLISSHFY